MLHSRSDEVWPKEDLEWLGKCPCCDGVRRTLLFEGLRDHVFKVAPGDWTLWRCDECQAGYLDPRPTKGSIGRAYTRYYTHQHMGDMPNLFRSNLRSRFKLGYLNESLGYKFPDAIWLGGKILEYNKRRGALVQHSVRHIPPPKQQNAKLLDIGCGNGHFLAVAQGLGYICVGIEPDPEAAKRAQDCGLDVRPGGIPGTELPGQSFDHICLNHVFEHLHDPQEALEEIFFLLNSGGRVWISQPNFAADGLSAFGEFWRGLEPPRHLSLHTETSLARMLRKAGFQGIRKITPAPVADFYFKQSLAMKAGIDPYSPAADKLLTLPRRWMAYRADATGESLTMIAYKGIDRS